MTSSIARRSAALPLALALAFGASACVSAEWGKDLVLHPPRRSPPPASALAHEEIDCASGEIVLRGWRFRARGERKGCMLYLHGIGDDRRGGEGFARRFTPLGLDVLAFDARAHGTSGGEACTYGVFERRDVQAILDAWAPHEEGAFVVLLGGSYGASVALQAAALDPRISFVVSIAAFSDLRTIAHERAPFVVSDALVDEALALAGREAGFDVDDASAVRAASSIRCPVLVVHGLDDDETNPDHARRIFDALTGEKELMLLPGVDHDGPLGDEAWERIVARVRARMAADGDESLTRSRHPPR